MDNSKLDLNGSTSIFQIERPKFSALENWEFKTQPHIYCRRSTGTYTIAHKSLHEVNKNEGKDMKPSQAINKILIMLL